MVGLAVVILLIGLASAMFSAANREGAAVTGPANATASAPSGNATDPANEPLAELGVAPSADTNTVATARK